VGSRRRAANCELLEDVDEIAALRSSSVGILTAAGKVKHFAVRKPALERFDAVRALLQPNRGSRGLTDFINMVTAAEDGPIPGATMVFASITCRDDVILGDQRAHDLDAAPQVHQRVLKARGASVEMLQLVNRLVFVTQLQEADRVDTQRRRFAKDFVRLPV